MTDEVFVFNTNLAFLYKIDIEGFRKLQEKIELHPEGIELTTPTIFGVEGRSMSISLCHSDMC